jgi:cupin fold WbuC family metalloprotein
LRDSSKSSRVQKVQEIELSPNGQVVALNIPAGQWHTVRALESGSVILEMKEGAYEPLQDCDVLNVQP